MTAPARTAEQQRRSGAISARTPIILWFRRDLRLSDHPALAEALSRGHPAIPVFIHDHSVESLGAAPRFRLELALQQLSTDLDRIGSRLILRRGDVLATLGELIAETGAETVFWTRLYDPGAIRRDSEVKEALQSRGISAQSFPGHVVFEPWKVETGQGGYYKVFTPFWRSLRGRDTGPLLPAPSHLPLPERWPDSDRLESWNMSQDMFRGREIVTAHVTAGETAALAALDRFCDERLSRYRDGRDFLAEPATSDLSHHLTVGEISARTCWHRGLAALESGNPGAETFLKELAWREFAYHLMYHTPAILTQNWRQEWDGFGWNRDAARDDVIAWQRGETGIDIVDAAMRELYVTGRMHNRARMIVASFLTKHLLTHWEIGRDWFEDCLIDWDPASNALGWQWVAGCGPDAAPYFRIFNPETQAKKFDAEGGYVRRWLEDESFFDAAPQSWGMRPGGLRPPPLISLKAGRERALAAYQDLKRA